MSEETLKLVTNPDLIRINQDEEARPAYRISHSSDWGGYLLLGKLLSNNKFAILFVNFADDGKRCELLTDSLGIPASAGLKLTLRDVFTSEIHDNVGDHFTVELAPHCCACFIGKIK